MLHVTSDWLRPLLYWYCLSMPVKCKFNENYFLRRIITLFIHRRTILLHVHLFEALAIYMLRMKDLGNHTLNCSCHYNWGSPHEKGPWGQINILEGQIPKIMSMGNVRCVGSSVEIGKLKHYFMPKYWAISKWGNCLGHHALYACTSNPTCNINTPNWRCVFSQRLTLL